MLVTGIVLAALGLAVVAGLVQVLLSWTAMAGVVVGILVAVGGGALLFFGGGTTKGLGLALIPGGILLAIMSLVMKMVLHLWLIHWLIEFGGWIILAVGIALAVIGLMGMFKGSKEAYGSG
jgi:hypothetical protein